MASSAVRSHLWYTNKTSRRLFSSSRSRRKHGPLTTFPPTSSPELDTILSTLRANVFLPSHLGRAHRDLVYKSSLQHHLTGDEPVEVTLRTAVPSPPSSREKAPHNLPGPARKPGDFGPPRNNKNQQTFILAPVNRFKDEPRTKPTVVKILELMQTSDDFSLLPDIFRELRISKRQVTTAMVAKAVRKAADSGHLGLSVELFRRHKSTGLRINNPEIAREFMRGAIRQAGDAEWRESSLEKVIQNCSTVFRLMNESKHLASKDPTKDARRMPEITGAMMALYAIHAVRSNDSRDPDGLVKLWTERTLALRGNAELSVDSNSVWDANQKMMDWSPVAVGGAFAMRVLGESRESQELALLVKDTQSLLKQSNELIEKDSSSNGELRRGTILYNDLNKLL